MTRVFSSRFNTGLRPGDGDQVDWQPGEIVSVISGQDEGRLFVVTSEGRSHPDMPDGELIREGYFTDDPDKTAWAKPEKTLWFGGQA
jgi:hypothetical protein